MLKNVWLWVGVLFVVSVLGVIIAALRNDPELGGVMLSLLVFDIMAAAYCIQDTKVTRRER